MSKNLEIRCKIMGNRITAFRLVRMLTESEYDFFEYVCCNTNGLEFPASRRVEHAMKTLEISEATYWRKIKALIDKGFIHKPSRNYYELDKGKFDVLIAEAHRLNKIKV